VFSNYCSPLFVINIACLPYRLVVDLTAMERYSCHVDLYVKRFSSLLAVCSSRFVIVISRYGYGEEERYENTLRIYPVGTQLDLGCFSEDSVRTTYWWQDGKLKDSEKTSNINYGFGALTHTVVTKDTKFYCGISLNEFPLVLRIQGSS